MKNYPGKKSVQRNYFDCSFKPVCILTIDALRTRPSSKIELFAKIGNGFQQLTIFAKSFSILDFWLDSEHAFDDYITAHSFKKKSVSFCFIYFLSLSIFHRWINTAENKYKWTQKFKNVRIFIKCTLEDLQYVKYELYSLLHLSKTAQQNLQHCLKLLNEGHNVLHDKIYWKIYFSLF